MSSVLNNYFDTSSTSLGIALVVFIASFFFARHFLNIHYIKQGLQEDNSQTIGFSFLIAVAVSVIVLFIIKKFLVYQGSKAILEEPFT
jgi:hypothetical protein